MKLWIIYDSRFGNNKIVAQDLADQLKNNNIVEGHYAKQISPKKVAASIPDALLFGGPRQRQN